MNGMAENASMPHDPIRIWANILASPGMLVIVWSSSPFTLFSFPINIRRACSFLSHVDAH
jgi:hypothetical protein